MEKMPFLDVSKTSNTLTPTLTPTMLPTAQPAAYVSRIEETTTGQASCRRLSRPRRNYSHKRPAPPIRTGGTRASTARKAQPSAFLPPRRLHHFHTHPPQLLNNQHLQLLGIQWARPPSSPVRLTLTIPVSNPLAFARPRLRLPPLAPTEIGLDYDLAVSIAYLGGWRGCSLSPETFLQSKGSWYMSQGSRICLKKEIWTPKIRTSNSDKRLGFFGAVTGPCCSASCSVTSFWDGRWGSLALLLRAELRLGMSGKGKDEGGSGLSCVGDKEVSWVRRVGEGVGWDIAGLARGLVRVRVWARVAGKWTRSICIRCGTGGNP